MVNKINEGGLIMKVKNVVDEDFINYKVPSMFIITPQCSMKCNTKCGKIVCQNYKLLEESDIEISKENLIERYLNNPITHAIVFGGLEPFDTEMDLVSFIDCLRNQYNCDDDVVIYSGYSEKELEEGYRSYNHSEEVEKSIYNSLKNYKNIIIKFGGFIPDKEEHFDEVLGIHLLGQQQYAKVISK